MAWQLPISDGDEWSVIDYYNQCASVCNSARSFFNDMRTAITGSTVNLAALATLSDGDDIQDGQKWYDLQNRINEFLQWAYHYDDVSNGADLDDVSYRTHGGSWELLITEANAILTTAGVHNDDKFDSSPTFGALGKIPFLRQYRAFPGGTVQTGHGLVEDGDFLNHTYMLNQIYACCVLIQSLTLGGVGENGPSSSHWADNYSYNTGKRAGDFVSSDADCGTAKSAVQSSYNSASPLFSTNQNDIPFALVEKDNDPSSMYDWLIARRRSKTTWDTLESGDLKTFYWPNDAGTGDFYDLDNQSWTEEKIYGVAESLGHTAATNTTALYGDYSAEPINANSADINCTGGSGVETVWYYELHPGFVLKTSIADPS